MATPEKDAVDAIKSRLELAWVEHATYRDYALRWPNDGETLPDEPEPLVYAEVIFLGENIAAFGGGIGRNEWETYGYLECQVLVPINSGEELSWEIGGFVGELFRGQRFSGLSFHGVSVTGGGVKAVDGNYWMKTVVAHFTYRHIG